MSGLETAVYYTIEGTPSKDKFYAYCTQGGSPAGSILISGSKTYGEYGAVVEATGSSVGDGKNNSAILLSRFGNINNTLWYWLNNINQNNTNKCNDWYIGSYIELERLRTFEEYYKKDLHLFDSYEVISSSIYYDTKVGSSPYYWYRTKKDWALTSMDARNPAVAIRSF